MKFTQKQFYNPSSQTHMRDSQSTQQKNTIWHWATLFLFACLVVASPIQQLLILLGFVAFSAIIKGPLMILWGTLYAFLIGLFPPLALAISLLFLLLQIGDFVKTWRVYLVGGFFYLYPLVTMLLHQFVFPDAQWFLLVALTSGLTGLHFLLNWLYKESVLSRSMAFFLLGLPYDFLLLLLPRSFKKKHNLGKNSVAAPRSIRR
ncbi:hypothetical protein BAU15_14340 [Enterococcus sp. JM4C]|uniref:hypothetical protein n=1 Tax=Candidatus Enterococcus huntleyi TaxID=1857217 RepID=UPI00137A6CC8|nr:hypothetical protein [Enterococcus sp. JM4C]KAF1298857.1 hypothetical protein BAU15_14340 [Enterococcus sp. JM4C]